MWQRLQTAIRKVFGCLGLVVIVIPVCIILGLVGTYAESCCFFWGLRVKRQMARQNRTMSRAELIRHLQKSEGTLIIESTTLGWGWSRAWWTADDVFGLAPIKPPIAREGESTVSREEKLARYLFEKWAHEKYTDLDSGRANLVQAHGGYNLSRKLLKSFPNLREVKVWSGGLEFRGLELSELELENSSGNGTPAPGYRL
jgi:hypothetical protein